MSVQSLLTETLAYECRRAEERAEGYLLLLDLALAKYGEEQAKNRRLEKRFATLATEYRQLHEAYRALDARQPRRNTLPRLSRRAYAS